MNEKGFGTFFARLTPARDQILGLRETIVQTLAFSWLLVAWYRRPHRAWAPVLYGLTGFGVLLSFAGWLAATAAPR